MVFQAMNPGSQPQVDDEAEEHVGKATSEEEVIRSLKGGARGGKGRSSSEDGGGGDAYEESEEEGHGHPFGGGGHGGQQVQCQNQ